MSKKFSIIVIDDSPDDADLLMRMLRLASFEFQAERADTAKTLEKLLEAGSWDIIVSKYSLSRFDGMSALQIVRGRGLETPFIMIGGSSEEELAVEILKAGAQDFICTSNLSRLAPTVLRELMAAEHRIARMEAENQGLRYRAIIEHTMDSILIVNSRGRIVDANQAALATYGYTLEELCALGEGLLRAPEEKSQLNQFIKEAIVATQHIETVNMRKDGSRFPVEVTTGLIELEDGPGLVSIIRDISARQQAEAELRNKVKELAEALEKIKMAQSQMLQQEKMAGIGQLAAGVAHEINNPLGFVQSNFESLQKYTRNFLEMIAAYKEFVRRAGHMGEGEMALEVAALKQLEKQKKIDYLAADVESLFFESKDGLDRVARIVKGLRTFSRVDRLDVFAEYDLNEGVASTLVVARNEIKYHADVETELGSVPMIQASGGQINQVLLNIIVNASHAIKAHDENRRGLIRIRTFEADNQVGCSIYNNGPAIPPDIIHRIFEPFFTTKKVGQGTGLGLSISYDIVVNLHHGRMTVVSNETDGTIFTFFIPVIPVVSNEEVPQEGRQ